MLVLEYLYNFPFREVEVRDIRRYTGLQSKVIYNAIKSLIARKVIIKRRITIPPTTRTNPPLNKIKVKIKPGSGYNKARWLIEKG